MALASSCNRDEAGLNPPEQGDRTVTITAAPAQTKTALDGGAVKWEDGDAISLVFTHPVAGPAVHQFSTALDASSVSADFTGTLPLEVYREDSGYQETVLAVYPETALNEGVVDFTLPAEQKVRENGTFADGLNLASASVSLADIRDDGNAGATFRNALSILRFTVQDDVTSVTLTGTSPLAGKAPLSFVTEEGDDLGRLVLEGDWGENEKSTSVTLKPADGNECFPGGEVNMLVWPGEHTSMSVTVNYKEYGEFRKAKTLNFKFEPAKYYTLDLNADSETIVTELVGGLEDVEGTLDDLEERLAALETTAQKVSLLLDQIQSVVLMTEYLDNAVYAPYAQMTYSKEKKDIKLDFIVRPAKAAKLLLEICAEEGNLSDVLCARIDYKDGGLGTLAVNDATLNGDILTVVVDAENISNSLYEGNAIASVALQISDGNTEILSDFARLVPKKGAIMSISQTEDIPVLKGAGLSMGFSFGAPDMSNCSIAVENAVGFASTPSASINSSGSGFFNANFAEDADLSQMSVDLVLTCGEESDRQTLTFAEGGNFEVETSGEVDYIGGEVSVNVVSSDYPSVTSELRNAGDWIYQTYSGSNNILTVNANEGQARSAEVVFTIKSTGSITYTKSVSVSQKAYGSPIDESRYHQDGSYLLLNQAVAGINPLNVVIVGDGYQKKDLQKGGKFERSARSACEAFFGVAPFSHFRDRFNIYMVAYESVDEGIDILSQNLNKDTYFEAYWDGNSTAAWVTDSGRDKVINVVKNTLGLDTDAEYYRTIALVLSNVDAVAGSCGYPYRDLYSDASVVGEDYASFAIAVLPANSTATGSLIRHELGGHGFGRLGDEYETETYGSDLDTWHTKGFYRNVTTNKDSWNWDAFIDLQGYENVDYIWRNDNYWCPSDGGIMYNNNGTFNPPCRQIIYERIIKQTEGYNAYSWGEFLEYDKRNIN